MIQMLEPMLSEIREEAVTTKRVLERVPRTNCRGSHIPSQCR